NNLIAQVQNTEINETKKTTTISYASQYSSLPEPAEIGDGTWSLMNKGEIGLLECNTISGIKTVYLDGKFENIAINDPLIVKEKGGTDYYGVINTISFEMKEIKINVQRWVSNDDSEGDTVYEYTITTDEGPETFYMLEKNITEVREVTKLTVSWLDQGGDGSEPPVYSETIFEKAANHVVYAGLKETLTVETKEPNLTELNGADELIVEGDFSTLEN
ncbi:MAG: hypothetical protein GY705_29460, partial [Bacteroidetes bacterium]|nr:hypothetical protein [Bacteroidota bacterium]